jgi:hypothetical protein
VTFDLVIFLAAALAIPVFGILDVLRMSPASFDDAGRSRTAWLVVQVAVPVLGTLAYYAFVRPRVRARERFGRGDQ